jgi:hypothetical protein
MQILVFSNMLSTLEKPTKTKIFQTIYQFKKKLQEFGQIVRFSEGF